MYYRTIQEDDDKWVIRFTAPGVNKEDVDINIVNGDKSETLNVRVKDSDEFYGFTKSFIIPRGIGQEHVSASLDKGILKIEVKRPEDQLTKIEVK
jgi:HSP20 family molecular chaperone IbpA